MAQGEEAGMDNPETKDWKKDLAALRFAVKRSSPAAFESIKVSRAERQTGSKEMTPFSVNILSEKAVKAAPMAGSGLSGTDSKKALAASWQAASLNDFPWSANCLNALIKPLIETVVASR